VVLSGSFHSLEQIAALEVSITSNVRASADEMVALMLGDRGMTFEQAKDLVMGSRNLGFPSWGYDATFWKYVTARLNRAFRISMIEAMQGLNTLVVGSGAIEEFCTGTIVYGGSSGYLDIADQLARARVCLALGPTQFTHTFSERLLLGMAAGCACVADDRWMIHQHFNANTSNEPDVLTFPATSPGAARERVESLLADQASLSAMALRGQTRVVNEHLWIHRLGFIMRLIQSAVPQAESMGV